jgi:hypothetical protein
VSSNTVGLLGTAEFSSVVEMAFDLKLGLWLGGLPFLKNVTLVKLVPPFFPSTLVKPATLQFNPCYFFPHPHSKGYWAAG